MRSRASSQAIGILTVGLWFSASIKPCAIPPANLTKGIALNQSTKPCQAARICSTAPWNALITK